MRRRRSRGPAMVSGRIRFAPSIASIKRNGTPPQWSPCRWVRTIASSESCSMPCCASAISDEVPKSIAKRELGPSTTMHVWKRPPLPKESPEPTNRTVTTIGSPSRRCRPARSVSLRRPAAPAAGLHDGESLRGRDRLHVGGAARALFDVVVQDVDFPVDAVWILDPELVLVGVAAVHAHLLAHG